MQEELSMEDLLELEALEIRGGRDGSGGTIGQDKCMNNAKGCGSGPIPQSGCSNNVEGCSDILNGTQCGLVHSANCGDVNGVMCLKPPVQYYCTNPCS